MKKITLLFIALLVGVSTMAQTITHNNSQVMVDGLGLTCQSSGITTDNQLSGVFDLTNDFAITGAWAISEVQFGVDEVIGAPGDVYPVTINIYSTDSGDPNGNLTLLGSQPTVLSSLDDLTVVSVPFATAAVAPDGAVLVVEVALINDGITSFRLGATDVASNDDSWIFAADCGTTQHETYATLGFADRWMVLNVIGADASGIADNVIDGFGMYPNPVNDVLNLKADINIDTVSIYNMLGQEVLTTKQTQIDMSALPTGSYIVKVQAGEQVASYNLVKS